MSVVTWGHCVVLATGEIHDILENVERPWLRTKTQGGQSVDPRAHVMTQCLQESRKTKQKVGSETNGPFNN